MRREAAREASRLARERHVASGKVETHGQQVFATLKAYPSGLTAGEIYDRLNTQGVHFRDNVVEVRRRLDDLHKRGLVEQGESAIARGGRAKATVWFPADPLQPKLL
jgi:Fe2+ or Zn2+ uptake regulation protein